MAAIMICVKENGGFNHMQSQTPVASASAPIYLKRTRTNGHRRRNRGICVDLNKSVISCVRVCQSEWNFYLHVSERLDKNVPLFVSLHFVSLEFYYAQYPPDI